MILAKTGGSEVDDAAETARKTVACGLRQVVIVLFRYLVQDGAAPRPCPIGQRVAVAHHGIGPFALADGPVATADEGCLAEQTERNLMAGRRWKSAEGSPFKMDVYRA